MTRHRSTLYLCLAMVLAGVILITTFAPRAKGAQGRPRRIRDAAHAPARGLRRRRLPPAGTADELDGVRAGPGFGGERAAEGVVGFRAGGSASDGHA